MEINKYLNEWSEVMTPQNACDNMIDDAALVNSEYYTSSKEEVLSIDESQRRRFQKRKLIDEEHFQGIFSKTDQIEETENYSLQSDSTFDTSEFLSMIVENPSLVIPPRPHQKTKLIANFVEAMQSQQTDTIDNSDFMWNSNFPSLGCPYEKLSQIPSKSKVPHEVLLFRKTFLNVLEKKPNDDYEVLTESLPDTEMISDSQFNNEYPMLISPGIISPSAKSKPSHSSEPRSVLNPLISTEPVEETNFELNDELTQNFEEEFHLELSDSELPQEEFYIELNDSESSEDYYDMDLIHFFEEELGWRSSLKIVDYPANQTNQSDFIHISTVDKGRTSSINSNKKQFDRSGGQRNSMAIEPNVNKTIGCSSAEVSDSELSDHSSLPPLEYEDEEEFVPLTSSSKLMCEQQDNSTVEPRKETPDEGVGESICTDVPISSVDTNNSTPKIPHQLDSPQEKQHCRPGPNSYKENVPLSDVSPVKELTQKTSIKAVTTHHETRLRIIRFSRSRPFIRASKKSSSLLNGDKRNTIPLVKSGTGDKEENQVCVHILRSASAFNRMTLSSESNEQTMPSAKSNDRNSGQRLRKSEALPVKKTFTVSRTTRSSSRASLASESQDFLSKKKTEETSNKIPPPVISPLVEAKSSSVGKRLRKSLNFVFSTTKTCPDAIPMDHQPMMEDNVEKPSGASDSTDQKISQEKSRRITRSSSGSSKSSLKSNEPGNSANRYPPLSNSTVGAGGAEFDSARVSTKRPVRLSPSVEDPKVVTTGDNGKSHATAQKTLSRRYAPFERRQTRSTALNEMLVNVRKSSQKKARSNIAQDQ